MIPQTWKPGILSQNLLDESRDWDWDWECMLDTRVLICFSYGLWEGGCTAGEEYEGCVVEMGFVVASKRGSWLFLMRWGKYGGEISSAFYRVVVFARWVTNNFYPHLPFQLRTYGLVHLNSHFLIPNHHTTFHFCCTQHKSHFLSFTS